MSLEYDILSGIQIMFRFYMRKRKYTFQTILKFVKNYLEKINENRKIECFILHACSMQFYYAIKFSS